MTTHSRLNAKQWLSLNKSRKNIRYEILQTGNKNFCEPRFEVLKCFDLLTKPIKNRRIDLLDEAICDFVTDYIYTPDNQVNPLVNSVMEFYEEITAFRL